MQLTQHHKIVKHCLTANDRSISQREALLDHGISCLHKRVSELEGVGYGFKHEKRKNPATGQRYTRYVLKDLSVGHFYGIGRDLARAGA